MNKNRQIWLQKYRPETLKDVYGNLDQINTLKSCVDQGSIPNLILSGPPGVGKTTSVLCIVREMLGSKKDEAVKQLNASDERGIDVVREQIKAFAHKKVSLPPGLTKVIILDEADSLTEGAQQALRMIISNFSETTRFVMSCNNSSKIIQAIQSRCIMLRFNKLKEQEISLNLKRIIQGENIKISEEAYKSLLFIADGDMRNAVNNLQACHSASQGKIITEQLLLHICDAPSIKDIKNILQQTIKGQIHEALNCMHCLYKQGHSVFDIVNTIHKVLMGMESQIKKDRLYQMLKFVAELKKRVLDGLTSQIQLGNFLCKCSQLK